MPVHKQTSLFDRLPDGLFSPLASTNRRLYWPLLLRLQDQFFGPDAITTPVEGFRHRSITLEIETFLRETGGWVEDEDDPPGTPLNALANNIKNRLVSSGWLYEERTGVRVFVYMPTGVQKFLELLRQFAEDGPQFVGGKVQSIYNNLFAAVKDPAQQAGALNEAAKVCRQLVGSLGTIKARVREVNTQLAAQPTTAAYVRSFFNEYITKIYIADYHELRTENHPLRHRRWIVQTARSLREDPLRSQFITAYRNTLRLENDDEATRQLETDIGRLLLFERIDGVLDALNDSVSSATQRALANIDYKLRTRDRFGDMLRKTIKAVLAADAAHVPIEAPFAAGPMFAESRLAPPVEPPTPRERVRVRRPRITLEQRAELFLRRAMQQHREVTPRKIAAYLSKELGEHSSTTSDQMHVAGIDDALHVHGSRQLRLSRISHATGTTQSAADVPHPEQLSNCCGRRRHDRERVPALTPLHGSSYRRRTTCLRNGRLWPRVVIYTKPATFRTRRTNYCARRCSTKPSIVTASRTS